VTAQRLVACLGIAMAAIGMSSCGAHRNLACAGQCAPPYELEVNFAQGTTHAAAEQILTSCAGHDPVVIRVGALRQEADGLSRAMVFTHDLGNTDRTAGLVNWVRTSGLTRGVGWPG
jgi:hypothetical protein